MLLPPTQLQPHHFSIIRDIIHISIQPHSSFLPQKLADGVCLQSETAKNRVRLHRGDSRCAAAAAASVDSGRQFASSRRTRSPSFGNARLTGKLPVALLLPAPFPSLLPLFAAELQNGEVKMVCQNSRFALVHAAGE